MKPKFWDEVELVPTRFGCDSCCIQFMLKSLYDITSGFAKRPVARIWARYLLLSMACIKFECALDKELSHMSKTILLVDASTAFLTALSTTLRAEGYEVTTAGDGSAAVSAARSNMP